MAIPRARLSSPAYVSVPSDPAVPGSSITAARPLYTAAPRRRKSPIVSGTFMAIPSDGQQAVRTPGIARHHAAGSAGCIPTRTGRLSTARVSPDPDPGRVSAGSAPAEELVQRRGEGGAGRHAEMVSGQ